jgi:hypothetical protein
MLSFALIKDIVLSAVPVFSLLILLQNYRRNQRSENELRFFKYKVDQYQLLVFQAYELLDFYEARLTELKNYKGDKTPKAVFIGEEIDDKIEDFRKTLNKNALLLPEEVIAMLGKFYKLLYHEMHTRTTMGNDTTLSVALKELEDKLEDIQLFIRRDLEVEKLHKKPAKRVSPSTIYKFRM